jgi:hypothetical protein
VRSQLNAVSCSSASNCVAVGFLHPAQKQPIIERWNGATWSNETAQLPPGSPPTELDDVSCPSQNDCYAVGSSEPPDHDHRYMQHWNGTRWATVVTPAPSGWQNDRFSALTCTVTVCTVVGFVQNTMPTAAIQPFVDRGAANNWTVEQTAHVGTRAQLDGVACAGSTCYAIGFVSHNNTGTPLFEQRAG